jgi:hypothetical protein
MRTPIRPLNIVLGFGLLAAIAASVVGCDNGTIPDPNDPNEAGIAQPEVLRNDLKGASDTLYERVYKGEITDQQAQNYLAEYADRLLSGLKVEKVPVDKAWEYGEVFRTARRWKQAKIFYEIAVKNAKDDDRKVNDSIHLAVVDCKLDDVTDAIKFVRSTFNVPPTAKAPILIGTLLEVVPSGRGKGHDFELAQLLEEAIPQAEKTIVNMQTVPGRTFIIARPHHVFNAWSTVVQLYLETGHPDLAHKAEVQAAKTASETHTI